jgi:glycosyltransferase involved in cell wall biosynthesis
MRILCTLVGAQAESTARAIELGRILAGRGHQLTYLGSFSEAVTAELRSFNAQITGQITTEQHDLAVIASTAAPDRMAQIARRLKSVVLVQESLLDLMSLKGDIAHWVGLFRAAGRIVFFTRRQQDKVFAPFVSGIDPGRMSVIPCGASQAAFAPRERIDKDHFSIATSGAVVQYRRQQDLIAAGERLRDFSLVFTLIGDTAQAATLGESTMKVIERHPARYIMAGARTGADALMLLRQQDMYVHTAADEAWSQAVIDSAAAATPLILSDIEAFSEPWVHGINCLKFPINRPDFLASTIRMVLQDDALRVSLAQAAQATARRYSAERYFESVVRMIEGAGA